MCDGRARVSSGWNGISETSETTFRGQFVPLVSCYAMLATMLSALRDEPARDEGE